MKEWHDLLATAQRLRNGSFIVLLSTVFLLCPEGEGKSSILPPHIAVEWNGTQCREKWNRVYTYVSLLLLKRRARMVDWDYLKWNPIWTVFHLDRVVVSLLKCGGGWERVFGGLTERIDVDCVMGVSTRMRVRVWLWCWKWLEGEDGKVWGWNGREKEGGERELWKV